MKKQPTKPKPQATARQKPKGRRRPSSGCARLRTVNLKLSISTAEHDYQTAADKIAAELRFVADLIEMQDAYGQTGTATSADTIHWEITDPWHNA